MRVLLASVVAAAIVGAAVAGGVTLAVLHNQSRTNPQTLNLGSRVTISEDTATADVARKAGPAVVSVVSGSTPPARGSGFLATSDGYVVTNVGVVAGAGDLGVVLGPGDARHDARVVDYDCETGLAVLKVGQVSNLPTLAFGDSSNLKLGQTVVAAGGDLSDHLGVTRGVVSGLHRAVTVNSPPLGGPVQLTDVIDTDAPIEPTSAGGPLLNVDGQVIGVTMARGGAEEGGVALASTDLQPEVEQIVQHGQLVVPSLGARSAIVTAREAAITGEVAGGRLDAPAPGGPADRAGLKQGDVVKQLDDVTIDDAHPLSLVLRSRFQPDQKVTVSYDRAGTAGQVQVTLDGERPACG
jgi:putative serine protease PepD